MLAMHTYADANRTSFPIGCGGWGTHYGGVTDINEFIAVVPRSLNADGYTHLFRHAYVPRVWPYMEQSALASEYVYLMQHFYDGSNANAISATVSAYYCPSDRPGSKWNENGAETRALGNYMLSFGDDYFWTPRRGSGYNVKPWKKDDWKGAPFGYYFATKLSEAHDGLSNTLYMSEVRIGMKTGNVNNTYDLRGDIFNDDDPGPAFYTITCPNSSTPDRIWCFEEITAPCENVTPEDDRIFQAARSRHTGGVNVALGDGSVQFVSDTIALNVWQAAGTLTGGEALSLQ